MKKKILIILCAICFLMPFTFVFTGCKDNSQITIAEIYDAFQEAPSPIVNGKEARSSYYNSNILNELLRWQRIFERHNIDTTDFMAMDEYVYYFDGVNDDFYIYIFKFSNIEASKNCYNNFDFTEYHHGKKYRTKRYGNLVIAVHGDIAEYAFDIIRSI